MRRRSTRAGSCLSSSRGRLLVGRRRAALLPRVKGKEVIDPLPNTIYFNGHVGDVGRFNPCPLNRKERQLLFDILTFWLPVPWFDFWRKKRQVFLFITEAFEILPRKLYGVCL